MPTGRNPLDTLSSLMRANIEALKAADSAFSNKLDVVPPPAKDLQQRSLADRFSIASIRQALKDAERRLLRRDARRRHLRRLRAALKA